METEVPCNPRPPTVKNTETELMSDKCKDYRVNKWTVLLPFKTHWICQHR